MKHGLIFLLALLVLGDWTSLAQTLKANESKLTTEQWREDLAVLARELPQRHCNAFFSTPEVEFRKVVADLQGRIPNLDEGQIVLGLARLAAMLHDGHTRVDLNPFASRLHWFPLKTVKLKDGVLVMSATAEHTDLNGLQLRSINGKTVVQILEEISPFYSWENQATRGHVGGERLTFAEMLRAAGVIANTDQATFAFSPPGADEIRSVELTSLLQNKRLEWKGVTIHPQGPALVSLQKRPESLWWQAITNTRALYVRYEHCRDDQNKTIREYGQEILQLLERQPFERLIIDLRQNGGGNSALLEPFITQLAGRKELKPRGAVITLIGHGTFSSAQLNAVSLRKKAHSVLIGDPTGQKPNAYGEIKNFKLPNSNLDVWYSTKHFVTEKGDPESTMPDVLVEVTMAEYLEGRDPAREAALAYRTMN